MSVIYKNGKWYGKGGGGGASDLGGLTDVTLTTPANGEVLKYDGSQWVNADEGHDSTKADAVSVAPAFDATATYAIGDRVTYEGRLYEFTVAHTGAWSAADVSETDVAEITEPLSAAEMQAVKDAFLASQVVPFATTMDVIDLRGNERVVGKVIEADGTEKVMYEKTIQTTMPSTVDNARTVPVGANIETVIDYVAMMVSTDGSWLKFGALCADDALANFGKIYVIGNSNPSFTNVIYMIAKKNTWINRPVNVTVRYTKV